MRTTDLNALAARQDYPAVSILMPTHRAHPETQQDPIRLKNLLNEARERLDTEVGKRPSWPIVDQLERLAETIDWRKNQDALALFASEHHVSLVRLPFTVEERVIVDRGFETREIAAAQQRLPRYLVLVLAEGPTRLFAATGAELEEVRDYGFPIAFAGAPGATRQPDAPQMARSNLREAHLAEFYREVDAALSAALTDSAGPVVLIGSVPSLSHFDEASRNGDHVIARIQGSHAEANADAIAGLAWPQVQPWLRAHRSQAIEELGNALGANRVAIGLDEAWNAARTGRGAKLIVEEDYRQPALIHRDTGAIEHVPAGATGPRQLDDAVDALAEAVAGKGGEVLFVEPGALADYNRVALLLRY